jgi:hypothetical protein
MPPLVMCGAHANSIPCFFVNSLDYTIEKTFHEVVGAIPNLLKENNTSLYATQSADVAPLREGVEILARRKAMKVETKK